MKFSETIIKKLSRLVSNTKPGMIMNRTEIQVLMGRGKAKDLDPYLKPKKLPGGTDPVYYRPEVLKAIEMYYYSLEYHKGTSIEPPRIQDANRDLIPAIR